MSDPTKLAGYIVLGSALVVATAYAYALGSIHPYSVHLLSFISVNDVVSSAASTSAYLVLLLFPTLYFISCIFIARVRKANKNSLELSITVILMSLVGLGFLMLFRFVGMHESVQSVSVTGLYIVLTVLLAFSKIDTPPEIVGAIVSSIGLIAMAFDLGLNTSPGPDYTFKNNQLLVICGDIRYATPSGVFVATKDDRVVFLRGDAFDRLDSSSCSAAMK